MCPEYDEANYPHLELTQRIIGAAMKVHTALGPGFLEKIYENALLRQLRKDGMSAEQQVRYPVIYEGEMVGEHILDLVVQRKVYVELKTHSITDLEKAQTGSGLKASRLEVGLIINFDSLHLKGNTVRVVRSDLFETLRDAAKRYRDRQHQPENRGNSDKTL